jgi:soluble lytic murein transglycosylase-like protein
MRRISPITAIWFLVSVMLSGLLLTQSYVSYKFPIKQDLFEHPYRTHMGNRLIAYGNLLLSSNKFSHWSPEEINTIIETTAQRHGVDPLLIQAITLFESYYLPQAISTTGGMGLMALMPGTARDLGIQDPFNPADNIEGGVTFVKTLSEKFQGDTDLILAAYNGGPGSVIKHGGVPPYRETTAYVQTVGRIYRFFKQESLDRSVGRILNITPDFFIKTGGILKKGDGAGSKP